MTENEIKEATLEDALYCAKALAGLEVCEECRFYKLCHVWCDDVHRLIVDALEEIQQYRAMEQRLKNVYGECDGLLEKVVEYLIEHKEANISERITKAIILTNEDVNKWDGYRAIGTIEEFKALKEKNTPMELAEHNFRDEVHHYLCPSCRSIVNCNQNYCEECGQALET